MHFTLAECWPVKPKSLLKGFFSTVLHTLARAYPGGVEQKGTGKASKSDDPVQIRKNPAAGRQPVAEGVT